jgi:excisionase family DNA binding protein
MEPLVSVEAAARLLSLSPWTVRAKIREGKLRPVRLGRRVLLEQAELQRFVDEARSQTSTQQSTGESQQ